MPFITTEDLKIQALWMSGEPIDGTSDYEGQTLDYLQYVYNTLITGGTIGTRDLATSAGLYSHVVDIPQTDWVWLRKFPSFAFNTTPACIGSSAPVPVNQGIQIGTMSLVYGDTTISFSTAPFFMPDSTTTTSVQGARVSVLNQEQGIPYPPWSVPRIASHTIAALTAELDAPWPQQTQTVSNFVIWRAEYPIPEDFERFCEAWKVQGGWINGADPLNVGSNEQVFDIYPITDSTQGPPTAAARMDVETLMMNRWDTFSYRVEGSYVVKPPDLVLGGSPLQQPVVPVRWRQILAIGAAMMILQDKHDDRTTTFASQFREILRQMMLEYRKEQNSGSELSMRMLYRGNRRRENALGTRSGLRFYP